MAENINPPRTPEDLLKVFQSMQTEQLAYTPQQCRYVIYARKSTDETGNQERSLTDQIIECKRHAALYNLNVVEIISEAESAKHSGTRPRFQEMIDNITRKGKYDAILSWHPDRLARNMKDAGVIIDLVDKKIIKDLKFVSFMFENSASGKMFLGITFAISKQYSDKLSDDVSRGNRLSIEEGKYINKTKHGYYKDPDQRLQPDGDNFILIKKAFQMRLEGKTHPQIAEFLNQSGYYRSNKLNSMKKYDKMTPQKVEKIMLDPVYAGILLYGKNSAIDLVANYGFAPMITVDEFMKINKLSKKSKRFYTFARTNRKGDSVKANLMRGMVICGECGEFMSAGITPKKTKTGVTKYFYYRCDNDDCRQKGKSVRAKVIKDYVCNFLNEKPFSSPASYESYVDEMKKVSQQRIKDARSALTSLRGKKSRIDQQFASVKELLPTEKDTRIQDHFREEFKRLEQESMDVDREIKEKEEFINKHTPAVLTYTEFIELFENTPKIIDKIANMRELDYIVRKMFSNFTIKRKKVIKSTLAAPFSGLETMKTLKCAG